MERTKEGKEEGGYPEPPKKAKVFLPALCPNISAFLTNVCPKTAQNDIWAKIFGLALPAWPKKSVTWIAPPQVGVSPVPWTGPPNRTPPSPALIEACSSPPHRWSTSLFAPDVRSLLPSCLCPWFQSALNRRILHSADPRVGRGKCIQTAISLAWGGGWTSKLAELPRRVGEKTPFDA